MEQQTVTLQRKQGDRFGFRLRRASAKVVQMNDDPLTSHEIIDVEEDGYAYCASLRNEDRLIEVR